MRTSRLLRILALVALLALACPATADEPIPLVFDTDMGNDIDDALALGLIHALQSHGRCKLLAVTLTKDNRYAGPFVDLVNTFYGRGDVPIGVVRNGMTPDDGKYLRPIVTALDNGQPRYAHRLCDGRDAPEATAVLRNVLAAQADNSVVIVQVGFSTNLARLLDSKPDDASPLDGLALVKRKVRLLSAMAGHFGPLRAGQVFKEYNIVTDLRSARKVVQEWPTPIVVSGFEVGGAILYPHRSIRQNYQYVPRHPLADAYALYGKMPYDRQTWDLTSVLYAVWPDRGDFDVSPPGRVIVEEDGATRFQPEAAGPHRYLIVVPDRVPRLRETFAGLCSQRPDGMKDREKAWAEAARKVKVGSTRAQPETRVPLENKVLRLDFDARSSDTAYQYIWLKRPDADRWERLLNFGIDVHAPESGDQRDINCVGMGLSLRREGLTMHVKYPQPLIQYRQFDQKIGEPELIRRYPDFTAADRKGLVHADASLEFRYELDPERPSFVVSGRVTGGRINLAIYILNALWTDNHALPTHEYIVGQPECDIAQPEAAAFLDRPIEKVAYVIFYRHDGDGVPFAYLPLSPERAGFCNFYDNWKCLYDFRNSALNQQFVPEDPPVQGCNDVGYIAYPRPDGSLSGVRVVFLPELGWRRGGTGLELRGRIERVLKEGYLRR